VTAKRDIFGELVEGVAAMKATDLQFRLPTSKLAVQERYNKKMRLSVSSCSLQGIAERPLPCNYNVIQHVSAFHGGNTGSNPVGDAESNQALRLGLRPAPQFPAAHSAAH